jgi:hypothetical protein
VTLFSNRLHGFCCQLSDTAFSRYDVALYRAFDFPLTFPEYLLPSEICHQVCDFTPVDERFVVDMPVGDSETVALPLDRLRYQE